MLITIIIIGVSGFSWYCNLVDETEFVINSSSVLDNSTVNWWIAP